MTRHTRLLALISLNGLAIALWFCRAVLVGPQFWMLGWNLFLAIVPWVLSLGLRPTQRSTAFWPVLISWLVFFPNAPYLVTDFVHLRPRAPVPMWFDVLFFASFAFAGCALGWDSLFRAQWSIRQRLGDRAALPFVFTCVALCGFGVFLGRFERLNSWELITDPLDVIRASLAALTSPRALIFSLGFSVLVGAGYAFTAPATSIPRFRE